MENKKNGQTVKAIIAQWAKSLFHFLKMNIFIFTLIGVIIAFITLYLGINRYKEQTESDKSMISLQMCIEPVPPSDSLGIWTDYKSWYMFINKGPATVKSANIYWFLNNEYIESSSKLTTIGSTHGVDVSIIESTTPGLCEIKVKDFPPDVGFMVEVYHNLKKQYINEVFQNLERGRFNKEFTRFFLSEIRVSGEKISIKNESSFDLEKMKKE